MLVADSFLGWDEVIRFGTVAAVVWSAAWFLFNQQSRIKDTIYKKFDELKNTFADKLEYHERHDDLRFDNINKNLVDIRIAQARHATKSSKFQDNGNGIK